MTLAENNDSKVLGEATINSDSVNNASAATVMKAWTFYVGMDDVSKPFLEPPDEFPPVDMVVMKPCVCLGFNNLDDEAEIPMETITMSGLTEEEIRTVMRDVSEVLERKSSCCWKWGWLGPIMLVIWWLDMILQQWHMGITLFLCQRPAMEEVKKILRKHNKLLKGKCTLSIVQDECTATTFTDTMNTIYFDSWLIEIKGDLVAQP